MSMVQLTEEDKQAICKNIDNLAKIVNDGEKDIMYFEIVKCLMRFDYSRIHELDDVAPVFKRLSAVYDEYGDNWVFVKGLIAICNYLITF